MFPPLQRGNELVIQFSEDCVNNHKISQDQILLNNDCDSPASHKKFATTSSNKLFYGAPTAGTSHQVVVDPNNHYKEKKMIHREIEKQRRKDMSTLHASLRSLLPLHFIKGKRSVSDQMNEAVNYIKQLEKNIRELSGKRDGLKKLSNNSYELEKQYENNTHKLASSSSSFSVHQNTNGTVGIEVTSGFRDSKEVIPLSKLLALLFEEGLHVVTCLSTQVNGRLLHSFHCQVNNSNCVDLSELRRKFLNVIPSFN